MVVTVVSLAGMTWETSLQAQLRCLLSLWAGLRVPDGLTEDGDPSRKRLGEVQPAPAPPPPGHRALLPACGWEVTSHFNPPPPRFACPEGLYHCELTLCLL